MKHILAVMLLLAVLCSAVLAFAEDTLPNDFTLALQNAYLIRGGELISASARSSAGAAVIRLDGRCLLSVLSCQDGQWHVAFENEHAACDKTSVYLDTEDTLILSNPFQCSDTYHEQYYFTLDGDWLLSSAISYIDLAFEGYPSEYTAALDSGSLYTRLYLTDAEGNILFTHASMTLPDVLTREEKLLSAFNAVEPPINGFGYFTYDSGSTSRFIIERLFGVIMPDGYTFVDGIKADDSLQFIADKADGSRVLLCCTYDETAGWLIAESMPLPAGTTIGIENFNETLNLGGRCYGVNIGRYPSGTWGVTGFFLRDYSWLDVGPGWVSEGMYSGPFVFGTHPWGDITQIDWAQLPDNLASVYAQLDTSHTATPNNPDQRDRLHLRAAASKDSKSLGKYYNGTPLTIISQQGEWTQVRVGDQSGYMMTKYLLTGRAVTKQVPGIMHKQNVYPLTEVLWDGESAPQLLTGSDLQRVYVIGVIGNEWYLIWDPMSERFGRIRQGDLWDGNG